MPTLSSAVSGKDWPHQPPTHAPTHPTVTAAMVFVDSTDKQEDEDSVCVCVSFCMSVCGQPFSKITRQILVKLPKNVVPAHYHN